jgi:Domain of unknown function (DUF4350)/Domain of unknown function (DUF4129)
VRAALLMLLLAAPAWADDDAPAPNAAGDEEKDEPELPPPPDPKVMDGMVKEVLGDARYRFCHVDDYPLSFREANEWCGMAEKLKDRCPSLARNCAKLAPKEHHREWSLPSLGSLPRILLFALLAAILLWLALKVGRHFVISRASQVPIGGEASPALEAAPVEVVPVESDAVRLLALARQAAAAGRPGEAIDHAYAALLRRLEAEGLVRVEKWRTNGDYLRDLRGKPDLRQKVAGIVRDVEVLQFGDTPPSAQSFEGLFARILPLVQGALAFLLMMVLTGCGAHRGPEPDSPSGMSAVRAVLEKANVPVEHRLKAIDKMEGFDGAILLFAEPEPAEWELLTDFVKRGGGLVVAARVSLPPSLGVKRTLMHGAGESIRVEEDYRDVIGDYTLELPMAGCLEGGTALAGDDKCTYAVQVKDEKGAIIILGDGQLFQNASLALGDNAAFIVSLLEIIRRPGIVQIVDEMTGQSSPNPFASLARAGLGLLLFQMALLMALWFWHRGRAFGRRHDPPPPPRRAFVEHVRAVGAQYAKAQAFSHASAAIDQLDRTGGPK